MNGRYLQFMHLLFIFYVNAMKYNNRMLSLQMISKELTILFPLQHSPNKNCLLTVINLELNNII